MSGIRLFDKLHVRPTVTNVLLFFDSFADDHTRVQLVELDGYPGSDYINANFIDGYCKEKAYIATQGPTKTTLIDFWRLCWEQNTNCIVMMTKLEERHRVSIVPKKKSVGGNQNFKKNPVGGMDFFRHFPILIRGFCGRSLGDNLEIYWMIIYDIAIIVA